MKQSEKDFLLNGIKRTSTKKGYYEYIFVLSLTLVSAIFVGGISILAILLSIGIYILEVSLANSMKEVLLVDIRFFYIMG